LYLDEQLHPALDIHGRLTIAFLGTRMPYEVDRILARIEKMGRWLRMVFRKLVVCIIAEISLLDSL
jgi:hypothetical protein